MALLPPPPLPRSIPPPHHVPWYFCGGTRVSPPSTRTSIENPCFECGPSGCPGPAILDITYAVRLWSSREGGHVTVAGSDEATSRGARKLFQNPPCRDSRRRPTPRGASAKSRCPPRRNHPPRHLGVLIPHAWRRGSAATLRHTWVLLHS
jgi:hypothetical protein